MISKFLGSFIFATLAFGASQAFASDTPAASPDTETTKIVEGSAHFEEHHTIIPLFCTQQQGCAKSRPYWTLIVNSSGVNYELDAQFALGSEVAPETVTVSGVVVRSGALISLEGTVEYTGDHYVLLTQARNVGILRSEASGKGVEPAITPVMAPIMANFLNWSCRGQLDDNTQIIAQVWSSGTDTKEEGSYHVRVSGSENQGQSRQFFNIGYVDDAHVSRDTGQLIYDGKNSDVSLTLSIQDSGVVRDAPGTLNMTVVRSASNQDLPADEQVNILCNLTR